MGGCKNGEGREAEVLGVDRVFEGEVRKEDNGYRDKKIELRAESQQGWR